MTTTITEDHTFGRGTLLREYVSGRSLVVQHGAKRCRVSARPISMEFHLCGRMVGDFCENVPADAWMLGAFLAGPEDTPTAVVLDYLCERCRSDWFREAVAAWAVGGGGR